MSQEILLEGDEVIVSSVSPLPPGKVSRRALGRNSCFFLRNQKDWDAILCHCLWRSVCVRGQHVNCSMINQGGWGFTMENLKAG